MLRVLLSLREPSRQYFDISIQKDFPMPWIGGEGKRRINFRVDALNLFNHPVFYFNSRGNTPFGFGTFPTEITGESVGGCSAADNTLLNTMPGRHLTASRWLRLLVSTGTPRETHFWLQYRANVNNVRLAAAAGHDKRSLPDDFFHVLVPQGFATTNPLAYDITTLKGFKLWRLRQTYEANFGTLTSGQVGNSFGSPEPRNQSEISSVWYSADLLD